MDKENVTREQLMAGLKTVKLIAECVRDLKSVPSGHLYATVMGTLSLSAYDRILTILSNAGLIEIDSNHMINWIGA